LFKHIIGSDVGEALVVYRMSHRTSKQLYHAVFLSGPACLPRPAYIFEACIRLDGGQASIYRPALAKIRPLRNTV